MSNSESGPRQPTTDEIPVDELIRITREFTKRITNQDRQRLALDLRESGHQRNIQITAPITLQQFFAGEIDLDTELARRFLNAPLLAHARFDPKPGTKPTPAQSTALLSTQDDSSIITFDAHSAAAAVTVEITFTLFSALGMRFGLSPLSVSDRRRWLDLMRRDNGIAFLWTRERWEKPYLIFVVREHFARMYAFSPSGIEAAARLTPDVITQLVDWLEKLWFPELSDTHSSPTLLQRPTQMHRPAPMPTPQPEPEPESEPEPGESQEGDLSPSDLSW
jgi:hypothetical protein